MREQDLNLAPQQWKDSAIKRGIQLRVCREDKLLLEQQLAEMKNAFHEAAMLRSNHLCELAELREIVPTLKKALLDISLCSQNSMTSKSECGHIARAALDATSALLKQVE